MNNPWKMAFFALFLGSTGFLVSLSLFLIEARHQCP